MVRSLSAFLAVAKEGNLTAAARQLGLEQPSVTRMIQKLEAELGAPLFVRLPRGVELTEFGRSFEKHALRIEAEYRFAAEEIAALKGDQLPTFRIGAGSLYHLACVPELVQRLVREFPQTQLHVLGSVNTVMLPMLHRGELDVLIGRAEEGQDRTYGLHAVPLVEVRSGVALRRSHPWLGGPLTPERLAEGAWVAHRHDDDSVERLTHFFAERGLPAPRIAVTTSSIETALRIIAGSDLLMLVPQQLRRFVNREGLDIASPPEPIWSFRSSAYFRGSSLRYPIVKRLTVCVQEILADLGAFPAEPEARSPVAG